MHDTVDEVGRVAAEQGTDFVKGGTTTLARTAAQHAPLATEVEESRQFGFGEEDLRWLTADEIAEHCRDRADPLGGLAGVGLDPPPRRAHRART